MTNYKVYPQQALLFAVFVCVAKAVSNRSITLGFFAALLLAAYWASNRPGADELGLKLIKAGEAFRAKVQVQVPVADFMIFFTGVIVCIQWHIFGRLILTQKGWADPNLINLFVTIGYTIPVISLLAFGMNQVTGTTQKSFRVNKAILCSELLFLGTAALGVSFFTQNRNLLVYSSVASFGLTYTVYGLWKVFQPRIPEAH